MGYQMPNVVKEVYLPFKGNDEDITPQEYKERYGIDLYEVFNIDQLGNLLVKSFTKLYIVYLDGLGFNSNLAEPVIDWVSETIEDEARFTFNSRVNQFTFSIVIKEHKIIKCGYYDNN